VKFTRKHPPLVDTRGIKTFTVIPLERGDQGQYHNFARNVTRTLTAGVKKARSYRFIDPAPLRNPGEADLSGHVDGYIVAKILKNAVLPSAGRKTARACSKTTDFGTGPYVEGITEVWHRVRTGGLPRGTSLAMGACCFPSCLTKNGVCYNCII
jgi:hypothetical protein